MRTIVTSTCPNHESMCTGKDVNGCGYPIGTNGDATEATDQGITKIVPALPILKTTYTVDDVKCEMGAIAYALKRLALLALGVRDVVVLGRLLRRPHAEEHGDALGAGPLRRRRLRRAARQGQRVVAGLVVIVLALAGHREVECAAPARLPADACALRRRVGRCRSARPPEPRLPRDACSALRVLAAAEGCPASTGAITNTVKVAACCTRRAVRWICRGAHRASTRAPVR